MLVVVGTRDQESSQTPNQVRKALKGGAEARGDPERHSRDDTVLPFGQKEASREHAMIFGCAAPRNCYRLNHFEKRYLLRNPIFC
jgi:hypothetical protein